MTLFTRCSQFSWLDNGFTALHIAILSRWLPFCLSPEAALNDASFYGDISFVNDIETPTFRYEMLSNFYFEFIEGNIFHFRNKNILRQSVSNFYNHYINQFDC